MPSLASSSTSTAKMVLPRNTQPCVSGDASLSPEKVSEEQYGRYTWLASANVGFTEAFWLSMPP